MASKKNKPSKPNKKPTGVVIKPVEVFTNEPDLKIAAVSISYKWLFYCLLLFFAVVLIAGALRVRIASDETIDYNYGKAALKYFTTHGKDSTYAHLKVYKSNYPHQKYYGAFVEMIAPAINKLFPRINGIKAHHVISAIFCLLLLFFTGQLARITINNRAAVLALLLIGLTPQILGNGFFNSKDIPFAAAYVMSVYFSVQLFQSFPKLNHQLVAGWILALALAIAIRVGGIVLIPLTGCFALIILITTPSVRKTSSQLKLRWLAVLSLSAIVAVILAGITYPNFWHEGFSHFSNALNSFKQFPAKITSLYQGDLLLSTKVDTGAYLFNYIFISFPELVLALILVGSILLLSSPLIKKPVGWFILLAAWFPIVYIISINAFIYNGWRHVMFAYPCMIIIAVYALSYFYHKYRSSLVTTYSITALLIISIIDLAVYNAEAYPYNYVYFNHLEGGVKGAYCNYDLDYQQLAVADGFGWLKENTDISKKDSSRIFTTNPLGLISYVKDTFKYKLFQTHIADIYGLKWNYAILSSNFISVKLIKFEYPPKGTIHTIERFGVPLAYVVKSLGVKYIDSLSLIDSGKYDKMIPILQQECKLVPNNIYAMYWLAFCYYKTRNTTESIRLLDTIENYHPKQVYVEELYSYNYFSMKKFPLAATYINYIYKLAPNNLTYNQILYGCFLAMGNEKEAQFYGAKVHRLQRGGR